MSDRTPIRAVLFDAVGTLIYPDPPAVDVYFEVGRRHGSTLDKETIGGRFAAAFAAQITADRCESPLTTPCADPLFRQPTSENREYDRWQKIVADVFRDLPQAKEKLFPALWAHFAEAGHWSVYSDVQPLLEVLAKTRLRLGIASNFDRRLFDIHRDLDPLQSLEQVFCSSRLGFAKPDVRFFRAIEETLQLPAEAIVFVGDDPLNDLAGGHAAGWNSLLIDRTGNRNESARLSTLAELPDLLAALTA